MLKRAVAALIVFLAAASTVGFALTGMGGPIVLTLSNIALAALGLVIAAAGIEAVRARHYWFALAVPASLALFTLAYAVAGGAYQAVATVVMYAVAAWLIAQSRRDFDRERSIARPSEAA